ncbi:hypothetical protein ASD06_16695 [Angustibacter sp. Root456]|nr:hypothetical protein ASD06_16695 [Angustibacter sp. Root456]
MRDLPEEDARDTWFEHWQTLSFVVVDWDLSPGSLGAVGSSTLSEFKRRALFDFLDRLMQVVYCPIFIISREDADEIKRQIHESEQLRNSAGDVDARITVFPKRELMENIVEHLTNRIAASPALSVLRTWEQEFDAARNRLFIDLNSMEPDWPVYVWRMAVDDGVDPAFELSSVISSNLLTRLNPVAFDDGCTQQDVAISPAAVRKVLNGRTFVDNSRLSERMVFPGDLFRLDGAGVDELWINISPVCQTVPRPGPYGQPAQPIRLHLIRGERADVSSLSQFRRLENRQKGPAGEVVHTLLDDAPYYFEFRHAQLLDWDDIRQYRIGRLLPPYATRFQQKHAAYLQAEGLPRVDYTIYSDVSDPA